MRNHTLSNGEIDNTSEVAVSHKYIYELVVLLFAFLSRALVSYWPWTSRSLLRFDGGSIKCVQG